MYRPSETIASTTPPKVCKWILVLILLISTGSFLSFLAFAVIPHWAATHYLLRASLHLVNGTIGPLTEQGFPMHVSIRVRGLEGGLIGHFPPTLSSTSLHLLHPEDQKVVGHLLIPSTTIHPRDAFPMPLNLTVLDADRMASMMASWLSQDPDKSIACHFQGRVDAHFLGFHIRDIHVDQFIYFPPLSLLRDIHVGSFDLLGPDPLGGVTLEGRGTLVGEVPIALELPQLPLVVYAAEGHRVLASMISDPLTLNSNGTMGREIRVQGRLLPLDEDPRGLEEMSQLVTDHLHGQKVLLRVQGSSYPYPGLEDTPSWLLGAVERTNLTIPLPPFQDQGGLLQGLEGIQGQVTLGPDTAYSPGLTGNAKAILSLPWPNLPLHLISMERMSGMVYEAETDPMDHHPLPPFSPIGTLTIPSMSLVDQGPMPHGPPGKYWVNGSWSDHSSLLVDPTDRERREGFESMISHALLRDSVHLIFHGTGDVVLDSGMGPLNLTQVPFQTSHSFPGFGPLLQREPNITEIKVVEEKKGELIIRGTAHLGTLPKELLSIHLGSITLAILHEGERVGWVRIPGMRTYPGHPLTVDTEVRLGQGPGVQSMLSRYISGDKGIKVEVRGVHNSSDTPSLLPALGRLHSEVSLPPLPGDEEGLVGQVTLHLLFSSVSCTIYNPLDVPILLHGLEGQASHGNQTIGSFDEVYDGPKGQGIPLPPRTNTSLPNAPVSYGRGGYGLVKEALGGTLAVTVDGRMNVSIGSWSLTDQDFHRSSIPVRVKWW